MDKLKIRYIYSTLRYFIRQKNKVLETNILFLGSIKKNIENNFFIETDIIDRIEIVTENLDTAQIVIGFMIDDKKRLLLN